MGDNYRVGRPVCKILQRWRFIIGSVCNGSLQLFAFPHDPATPPTRAKINPIHWCSIALLLSVHPDVVPLVALHTPPSASLSTKSDRLPRPLPLQPYVTQARPLRRSLSRDNLAKADSWCTSDRLIWAGSVVACSCALSLVMAGLRR